MLGDHSVPEIGNVSGTTMWLSVTDLLHFLPLPSTPVKVSDVFALAS